MAVILFLGFGAFSSLFSTDLEVLNIAWSGILVRNYKSESFTSWAVVFLLGRCRERSIGCALLMFYAVGTKGTCLVNCWSAAPPYRMNKERPTDDQAILILLLTSTPLDVVLSGLSIIDIGPKGFKPIVNVVGQTF